MVYLVLNLPQNDWNDHFRLFYKSNTGSILEGALRKLPLVSRLLASIFVTKTSKSMDDVNRGIKKELIVSDVYARQGLMVPEAFTSNSYDALTSNSQ